MAYQLGETLLKLTNISLAFEDFLVLRDINIEIKDIIRGQPTGQVCSVLGKSGAGKTQLFKVIAGLQKPTTGEVLVGQEQQPTAPGKVGVVAQNYPLFVHRTLIGNLKLVSNDKDKIEWYLNELNLYEHKDKYPSQLSGGQRQRTAIIQQLLCSEHLLLLDEPMSGLDPVAKQKVCDIILKVAHLDSRNNILIISHDIESCLAVSDSAWVMGHDYKLNEETGKSDKVPGAYIKYTLDLAADGLAWEPDIASKPEFIEVCQRVKSLFKEI